MRPATVTRLVVGPMRPQAVHAGPRDGQRNVSAIVETTNSHSKSASALDDTGSDQKTVVGIVKTTHGQKGSGTSHGKRAVIHETTNNPWSESATLETGHSTLETVNGHSDVLRENLDLTREINVKSGNGSGP